MREEVFGPIAPLITVRSEEEMIRIANETEFGLGAAIWTGDILDGGKNCRRNRLRGLSR